MSGLYSFGTRNFPAELSTETIWMVTPEGDTTWDNGGQLMRRLHQDESGFFTHETAPGNGRREEFPGQVPTL